jgi:hypothetical protein
MSDLPRDNADSLRQEVYELADALLSDALTEEEVKRLSELVCKDAEARRHYVCFMHDSAAFHQWSSRISAAEESGVEMNPLQETPSAVPFPSIVLDPSPAASPSVFSLNSSLGGMAFSYLMSALLVCLGMLVGLTWNVSEPRQVVDNRGTAANVRTASMPSSSPKMVLVGRITGLADCRFSEDNDILPPLGFAHVPLGRKFKLDSGLMEITYDTGAKVILQGPVTYEVESSAGGFLSMGKLTAKIEKGEGRRVKGKKSGPLNSQLSTLPSPLFSVRTPAAIITDLGTEFGVEVGEEGGVTSEVFQGLVKVQVVGGEGKRRQNAIILGENESASVKKYSREGDGKAPVIRRIAPDPKSFVRRLPKPKKSLPMQVLAYFRLGEDDPGALAGKPAGQQTFNHERGGKLERHGSPTYTADTASPGSTLAMSFTGKELEYFASKDLYLTVTEGFILEAWVRVHAIPQQGFLTLVFNGNTDLNGYGLLLHEGRWKLYCVPAGMRDSGVSCEADRWTHLALVCESGKAQIWVNGQPAGQIFEGVSNIPIGSFAIGGNPHVNSEPPFDGQIDEVRISVFQGRFQPDMLLFPANRTLPDKDADKAN